MSFILILIFLSTFTFAQNTPRDIVKEAAFVVPSKRQLEWQKLEMTAFFHFGINTFTDKEWGNGTENPKIFNPKELDCNQWIKSAKAAGVKLAIITAKHHDGFCLWPSKYTEHTVKNSPYKNGEGDIVREFIDACRYEGLKAGIYLSPWDRHEKTYGTNEYNDFFVNQIKEILTEYGPIDEFWFDGACGEGPNGKKQIYDWNRYYKTIRSFNDKTVIAVSGPDVRWVGNESGLARESEWSVVPASVQNTDDVSKDFEGFHFENIDPSVMKNLNIAKPEIDSTAKNLGDREQIKNAEKLVWFPAECDVSIRPGWFYHKSQNRKVKTLSHLMDIYYKSVGRNSVLLLNIPPDKRGLVYEADVKRLQEFGNAIKENFSNNLLSGISPKINILDKTNFSQEFIFSLPNKIKFNTLKVAENIANGQRVEKFSLWAFENNNWIKLSEATTVGYKRLVKFKSTEADKIKVVIEQARWTPEISAIALYDTKF